jgi:hypothetical protein
MKLLGFVLAFLGALLLTGCQGNAEDKAKKAKEQLKAEAEVLHKEMTEHLEKLDKQYEEWKAKAGKATGEAKTKMESKLEELEKDMAKVKGKLGNLKNTAPEMWKEAKEDVSNAVHRLKEAFEKGKEHFK